MGIAGGGYYLLRPAVRADYMNADLLPDRVVSISACICDFVSADWAVAWGHEAPESRVAEAARFGVRDDALERVTAWAAKALDEGELLWPNVFPTVDCARWVRAEFLADIADVKLVGAGLPEDYCSEFLDETTPLENQGEIGPRSVLKQHLPLARGGSVLGFEILGLDFYNFHSSVCNSLENEFAAEVGVVPNLAGFIDDEADARRCAEYAGLETTRAEPALWQPWQIVLYE